MINVRFSVEIVLMRSGGVTGVRAWLNRALMLLMLEGVNKADEGVYTVRNPEKPDEVERVTLFVRDCSYEQAVKYGDDFHIQVQGGAFLSS